MRRELFPLFVRQKLYCIYNLGFFRLKIFSRQKPNEKQELSTSLSTTTTTTTTTKRPIIINRSMSNNSSSPTSPHSFTTPLSQFELEREARIAKNVQRMKEMGLENLIGKNSTMFPPVATPTPRKVRREDFFVFVIFLSLSFFLSFCLCLSRSLLLLTRVLYLL